MDSKAGIILTVVILVGLLGFVVAPMISSASNTHVYTCPDATFSRVCSNTALCTNATYACLNASYPILNVSTSLCTNASGVSVFNLTPSDGCAAFTQAAHDDGTSAPTIVLLSLLGIILAVSVLYMIGKGTGLVKA